MVHVYIMLSKLKERMGSRKSSPQTPEVKFERCTEIGSDSPAGQQHAPGSQPSMEEKLFQSMEQRKLKPSRKSHSSSHLGKVNPAFEDADSYQPYSYLHNNTSHNSNRILQKAPSTQTYNYHLAPPFESKSLLMKGNEDASIGSGVKASCTYLDVFTALVEFSFPKGHPFCSVGENNEVKYGCDSPDKRQTASTIVTEMMKADTNLKWIEAHFAYDLTKRSKFLDMDKAFNTVYHTLITTTDSDNTNENEAGSEDKGIHQYQQAIEMCKGLCSRLHYMNFVDLMAANDVAACGSSSMSGILLEMNRVIQAQVRLRGEHIHRLHVYNDDHGQASMVTSIPDITFVSEKSTAWCHRACHYVGGVTVKVIQSEIRQPYYPRPEFPNTWTNLPKPLIDHIKTHQTQYGLSGSEYYSGETHGNNGSPYRKSIISDIEGHIVSLLSLGVQQSELLPSTQISDMVSPMGMLVVNDDIYFTRLISNVAKLRLCTSPDRESYYQSYLNTPLKHLLGNDKAQFPLVTFMKTPLNIGIPAHRLGIIIFLKYYTQYIDLSNLN